MSGGDKDLRSWNKDRGKCTKVLRGHNRMPTCLIQCRDGKIVTKNNLEYNFARSNFLHLRFRAH